MNICPCSNALGICKKIRIRTYFGSLTVESVRGFCHFALWRHGFKLATFFIVHMHCIFWGTLFKLIKNLAPSNPEKTPVFHEFIQSHCYTLMVTVTLKSETYVPIQVRTV